MSLGVRLGAFPGGVLIRLVEPRLTLAERLAADAPMEGEATEALPGGLGS